MVLFFKKEHLASFEEFALATKTWNGSTADWNVGTDWTGGLPGSLDLAVLAGAAPYLVTLGTSEFEHPGSLSITGSAATLAIASGGTLAVASLLDLAAGTLALGNGGVLQGGTLDLAGGTLVANGGTFDGVTILGNLTVASLSTPIAIKDGLTFAAGSTLTLNNGQLYLLDNETLDNATILGSSYIDSITSTGAGSLTLGSHLTLVAASIQGFILDSTTLTNHGTLDVAAGSNLELEFAASFFNNGVVSVAAGGTLSLDGPLTTPLLKTIAAGITDLGALQIGGAFQIGGTILTIPATGSLSDVSFVGGSVNGGTLVNAGSLAFYDEDLSGLSLFGPLVIEPGGYAEIGVGTTLLSATGGPGGTIIAGASAQQLDIDTGVTLVNTLIRDGGSGLSILGGNTLVLGAGLDVVVASSVLISANTLFNGGTIAGAPGASVDLSTATVFNTGTIAVGAAGTLEVDVSPYGYGYNESLDYHGVLPMLGAGSTLVLGTEETTAQLLALLGTQTGETVELFGTLINTGTRLLVGSGDAISHLLLAGSVIGGTIDNFGGGVTVTTGSLVGVTFLGPVAINAYNATVDVLGGLTLHGTDGVSPGSLAIAGYNDALVFGDTETFDNATVALGSNANGYGAPESIYGTTLTLGARLTLADTSDLNITATTLVNAGSLSVTGVENDLSLYANSIANPGAISIGPGAALGLDLPVYNTVPLALSISDPGSIRFAPGASLDLGGITTTATLNTLLGTASGVTTLLLGTLQNAASTIDSTAGGPLGTIVLDGDLVGGTLIGAGGTVAFGNGTLDGVIVQGGFTLDGTTTLTDGVAFSGIGGAGPATLTGAGYSTGIRLLDAESLANVVLPVLAGQLTVSTATSTLSIAASTTITLAGRTGVSFDAATIVNAGSVTTTGTLASVLFGSGTIVQGGVVVIGSADVLGLDIGGQYAPIGLGDPLSLTGSFALAAGATLELGEQQTTVQLQTLLGQISNPGVAVELLGTLRNAGTSLAIAPGLLGNVTVDGDIVGGSISQNGGTLAFLGGTLDGVQVLSAVTLAGGELSLVDAPAFDTASGVPGGTLVSTDSARIQILDAETFDHVTVAISNGALDITEAAGTAPLVLGAGASFDAQGGLQLDTFGTEIVTAATIIVAGVTTAYAPSSFLDLDAATIVNTGVIRVGAGGVLAFEPGQATTLTLVNSGVISLAAGATLDIGSAETTAQLLALLGSLATPGVVVKLDGSIDNTGAVLNLVPGGTLGDVVLAGEIDGGTIIDANATVDFTGARLDNVLWQGPLTLAHPGDDITLGGTSSVQSAAGGPGTLTLAGNDQSFDVNETSLSQLGIVVSGLDDSLSVGTLTLAASVQATISGQLEVSGQTLINAGTIALAGHAAELLIATASFVNTGVVAVGSSDILGVDINNYGEIGLPFTSSGGISLAAGATLQVGGTATTAELLALVGSLGNAASVADLTGTILNLGATLGPAASPGLTSVILDADVIGGTIAPGAGTYSVTSATLDGVTWLGTLGLSGFEPVLTIADGLTLTGPAGIGPGTLLMPSFGDGIDFLGAQTLDQAVVLAAAFGETFRGSNLTFGSGLTLDVTGQASVLTTTFTNSGTINVLGAGALLDIAPASFVNNGIITVGSGDVLGLEPPAAGDPLLPSGSGSIDLLNGSTLAIGGVETTAQLLALLGSISHPGVTVELVGTLINTGATLDALAGSALGNLVLDGNIVGGTVKADGGSLTVLGGVSNDVTYDGVLALQGRESDLFILGTLDLENQGSLPGTIYTDGNFDFLDFPSAYTLANLVILGTSSLPASLAEIGLASFAGITAPGTLSIASSVFSDVNGGLYLESTSIANAGTFVIPGTAAVAFSAEAFSNSGNITATAFPGGVVFDANTFSNTGTIAIGPGDVIAFGHFETLTYSNQGVIEIASGATIGIGAIITPTQLEAFIGSLVTTQSVVVGLDEYATFLNQGGTFTIPSTGSLSELGFAGGEIVGGTIVNQGTALFLGHTPFEDVTWVGPLGVVLPDTSVVVIGSGSFLSAGAGPETLAFVGTLDSLVYDPADTTELAPSSAGTMLAQTVSNEVILLGQPGSLQGDSFELFGQGVLTLATSTTIEAIGNATVEASAAAGDTATLFNLGVIVGTGGLELTAYSPPGGYYAAAGFATFVNAGLINAGGVTAGATALDITGQFVNAGLIAVAGPGNALVGQYPGDGTSFANTGTISLSGGATLDFFAPATQAGIIVMADAMETLRVDAAGRVAATLVDFVAGDTIDLAQVADNATIAASGTFAAGVLDIYSGGTLYAVFALPSYPYGANAFVVAPDGDGGTRITTTTACFHVGTRIRTSAGDVPVEALRVGMRVPTLSGEMRPIRWIGQRRLECARHPNPETVLPVRVRADAFGPGQPGRDLLLSPDHAVWHEGVLIPIQYLVNGVTIQRENVVHAHYFHVELDAHAVLFAEGLPAESYLDTGNRTDFEGGAALVLFPKFAANVSNEACAPLCVAGPLLAALRQRLFASLDSIEVGLKVSDVGGKLLRLMSVKGQVLSYAVPPSTREVAIVSETGVPAETNPLSADRRRLGIAIGSLVLDGRLIGLSDPRLNEGFHAPEPGRRWTDGAARLVVGKSLGARVLQIQVLERARRRPQARVPVTDSKALQAWSPNLAFHSL